MADFKKLTVDGNTYNVKDEQARSDAASAQNTASAAYTAANLKMPLNGLFIGPVDSKATDSMALGSTAPNSTTTLTAGTGALQSGISLTAGGAAAIKGSSNVTIDSGSNVIVSSADIDVQTDSGRIYTDDNDIRIEADDIVRLQSGYGYALSNSEIIATRPWVLNNIPDPVDPSPLPLDVPYNHISTPDINALKKKVKLVGGTVVWNQLVQNGTFEDTTNWGGSGVSLSASDNKLTVTVAAGSHAANVFSQPLNTYPAVAGHKYLVGVTVKINDTTPGNFSMLVSNQNYSQVLTANTETRVSAIISAGSGNLLLYIYPWATGARTFAGTETAELSNVELFDLTLMFGSTIADYIYSLGNTDGAAWFQLMFPSETYAYNEGTLYSVNPDKSITKSSDQSETSTYELNHPTLNGLFKLDAGNKLYADGDTYEHDGTVTHNYEYRAYQAGDESLPDAITDGTHTVVKLVTPTTEQIATFDEEMIVYPGGTEALTDYAYTQGQRDVEIPVGNNTLYVRRVIAVPAAPMAPGQYWLGAYVDNDGNTYYTWEA